MTTLLFFCILLIICANAQYGERLGIDQADVDALKNSDEAWYNASITCDTERNYDSSTLAMLRAHFAESASHFTSPSVSDTTQKQGTDRVIAKAICIKDAFAPRQVGENVTSDFMLGVVNSSWTTDDLDAHTGHTNQLAKAASRIEVVSGHYTGIAGKKFKFKASKYHYDFVCSTSDNYNCPPVDQLHCVNASFTYGRPTMESRSTSSGVCYIRQQPVYLDNSYTEVTGRLQFPILSMARAYTNGTVDDLNIRPQFTFNTIPGINDANYSTYNPGTGKEVSGYNERRTMNFDKFGSWRAVPQEAANNDECTGAKGSLTPDQSINGGFPLIVEENDINICVTGQNYFQVAALTIENIDSIRIFSLGRTPSTGSCASENVVIRGLPLWTSTIPPVDLNSFDTTSYSKDPSICIDNSNSTSLLSDDVSSVTACKMPYCSPLYVPDGSGQLVEITPLIGDSGSTFNYTQYGGDEWPRSQYDLDSNTAKDGILCNTNARGAAVARICLVNCANNGHAVGRGNGLEGCQSDSITSATCKSLLSNYTFSVTKDGISFDGNLAQTGLNTLLSPYITQTTQSSTSGTYNIETYVGQSTLNASTIGSHYAGSGCVHDFGKFVDYLNSGSVLGLSDSAVLDLSYSAVQALLNATTALSPVEDGNLEQLASTAALQVSILGNELTGVDVAVVIASTFASLASVINVVSKDGVRRRVFSKTGIPAALSILLFTICTIIACGISLMPVIIAIKQEFEAINKTYHLRNINAQTSDVAVSGIRHENVYTTIVEIENDPANGTTYIAALFVTCGLWMVAFAVSVIVIAYKTWNKKPFITHV